MCYVVEKLKEFAHSQNTLDDFLDISVQIVYPIMMQAFRLEKQNLFFNESQSLADICTTH